MKKGKLVVMNKKGAITDDLTGLAYGIIALAIIVGIGSVVLSKFAETTASCPTGYTYNSTSELCVNDANSSITSNPSTATQTSNYLNTQLGQSGLAGWVPAIIALSVGLVFLYMFLKNRRVV